MLCHTLLSVVDLPLQLKNTETTRFIATMEAEAAVSCLTRQAVAAVVKQVEVLAYV